MLKTKGMTLIESLLAFSIFITVVVVVFSGYINGLKYYQENNESYQEYIEFQNDKELGLWQTNELFSLINEVLH